MRFLNPAATVGGSALLQPEFAALTIASAMGER